MDGIKCINEQYYLKERCQINVERVGRARSGLSLSRTCGMEKKAGGERHWEERDEASPQ